MSAPDTIILRQGSRADHGLVAGLHAASWRSAYRDILDPEWLAGALDANRQAAWRERLAGDAPSAALAATTLHADMQLLIAEQDGAPWGFVCAIGKRDARWGTLVDNLHVLPAAKGHGVGAALLRAAAGWSARAFPDEGLHLFCYARNSAARGFYAHMGGRVAEEGMRIAPDGREAA